MRTETTLFDPLTAAEERRQHRRDRIIEAIKEYHRARGGRRRGKQYKQWGTQHDPS